MNYTSSQPPALPLCDTRFFVSLHSTPPLENLVYLPIRWFTYIGLSSLAFYPFNSLRYTRPIGYTQAGIWVYMSARIWCICRYVCSMIFYVDLQDSESTERETPVKPKRKILHNKGVSVRQRQAAAYGILSTFLSLSPAYEGHRFWLNVQRHQPLLPRKTTTFQPLRLSPLRAARGASAVEAVGLVKRGGGDSRQILIAASSEYPGEEVALPRGLRGRRSQLLRSL